MRCAIHFNNKRWHEDCNKLLRKGGFLLVMKVYVSTSIYRTRFDCICSFLQGYRWCTVQNTVIVGLKLGGVRCSYNTQYSGVWCVVAIVVVVVAAAALWLGCISDRQLFFIYFSSFIYEIVLQRGGHINILNNLAKKIAIH